MRFVGGPRDGEQVEPEHTSAEEIHVTSTNFDHDNNPIHTSEHTYLPDAFGRMVWQNPQSMQ